ncbi:hypothetical protein DFH11DRAFT_100959 [Phellopilus nigrolimitatus]|nr:hypothetical protein DFH11DRAFT_100959 [Phellopilus nigrolimitatus]
MPVPFIISAALIIAQLVGVVLYKTWACPAFSCTSINIKTKSTSPDFSYFSESVKPVAANTIPTGVLPSYFGPHPPSICLAALTPEVVLQLAFDEPTPLSYVSGENLAVLYTQQTLSEIPLLAFDPSECLSPVRAVLLEHESAHVNGAPLVDDQRPRQVPAHEYIHRLFFSDALGPHRVVKALQEHILNGVLIWMALVYMWTTLTNIHYPKFSIPVLHYVTWPIASFIWSSLGSIYWLFRTPAKAFGEQIIKGFIMSSSS